MTTDETKTETETDHHRFEPPVRPFPGLSHMARDLTPRYVVNGLIGLIFAATGPVAVILAVGEQGGLTQAQLASWIFGIFFVNGILTILATGVLILLLGLSGWVGRVMAAIPMPIVMAMVAGVFLSFGLDLVHALVGDIAIAGPMVAFFLLLSWHSSLGRWVPPVIGALLLGGVAVAVTGRYAPGEAATQWIATPMVQMPQWSWQAMLELVVPLAITVLVVQNGQGVSVLRSAGHSPPVNMVAIACGAWSMLTSFFGSVSTCLTGPTNALLTASGQRSRHYIAGISCGVLAVVFGLFAPLFTHFMLAMPGAFVTTLGGLAMLKVLQNSFVSAFHGRFTFGALITFVVTVADVQVLNIGSAFWGLAAGLAVSGLLERSDFSR